MSFTKPEGLILVHVDPAQFNGTEVYGVWPSGLIRQITEPEYKAWGEPPVDRWIEPGDDATAQAFKAYDKALRA